MGFFCLENRINHKSWHIYLGGALKYFEFSPRIPGEDDPIFDVHIFQVGWFNHQLVTYIYPWISGKPPPISEQLRGVLDIGRHFWCHDGQHLDIPHLWRLLPWVIWHLPDPYKLQRHLGETKWELMGCLSRYSKCIFVYLPTVKRVV